MRCNSGLKTNVACCSARLYVHQQFFLYHTLPMSGMCNQDRRRSHSPFVAGTSTGVGQSSANSSKVWTGSISLADAYYNITLESHVGGSGGALLLRAGNTAAQAQVMCSDCAFASHSPPLLTNSTCFVSAYWAESHLTWYVVCNMQCMVQEFVDNPQAPSDVACLMNASFLLLWQFTLS